MSIGHDDVSGEGDGRFATDFLGIDFHGESQSHIDALSHVSYRGKLYNGEPIETVMTSGATVHAVDDNRNGIIGRGVLIDAAQHRRVSWLRDGLYDTHTQFYEHFPDARFDVLHRIIDAKRCMLHLPCQRNGRR
jgi:kynurenine formamidase